MANSFKFYSDAALTSEISTRAINHLVDGTGDPQDLLFYYGSPNAANKVGAASAPGVDDISISISNATPLWAASTTFAVNSKVRTTAKNGYQYKVQSVSGLGLTGGSEPVWPTVIGNTVSDNLVIWVCEGKLHESTEIKLALTNGGLAAATAGAALSIGTVVLGGSANAVPVHVRIDDATAVVGAASELSIRTNNTHEIPVGSSW